MAPKNPTDDFQDTRSDPFDDEPFETTRQQTRRVSENAHRERTALGQERRQNDVVVDRKLNTLHHRVADLRADFSTLTGTVGDLADVVRDMKSGQDKNNEMTEKMLGIVGGGKMLISLIKFCGVMAVPITAIVTAIIAIKHGIG